MATTGQFWFLTLGTAKDARVDYIDVLALNGSNTAGAQQVLVDNDISNGGTTTDLVSNYPEDVQVDWAAGVYFVIINGNPATGAGGEVLMGHTNSSAAPTVVYTAPASDVVNTIQIDQYSHHLYVQHADANLTATSTGILDFTYSPATVTPLTLTPVATNGGYLTRSSTESGIPNNATVGGVPVFDPRDFALDHNTNTLFFVNQTDGTVNTNEIYRLNLSSPDTITPLLKQSQFPTPPDGNSSAFTNGYVHSVEVDPSTSLVYFTTYSQHPSPDATYNAALNKIYWISESASGSIDATALTITGPGLPAGNHFYPGKITFDLDTRQIYVASEETDTGGVSVDDVIYVLQLDASGHSASLLTTISPSPTFETDASNFSGMTFDELPALGTLSATSTHPAEQDVNVTLLTGAPTLTDSNGDHLNNATVQITGGTFSSNENTTADDHLTIDPAHRVAGGTNTSGTISISGNNITYSYDSATEKLTLSGYDTLADYQTALTYVQYFTTGDNPTNYGNDASRTVTWQVNDGAVGNPSGTVDGTTTNARTTTVNIDAKNDAPVNHLPATPSINEDVQTAITGLSITDVDADPANQDITVTLSLTHGTLNLLTNVAGGITGGDITGGAQDTNTITITATQNQINNTITGNGLRYTGNLNFNTTTGGAEALHIVTNDNSHTDSAAFSGAQSATNDLSITVNPVNDSPVLSNVGPSVAETEQTPVLLDTNAAVSDVDLDPLNAGAGSYTGASLTVVRNGGANAQDTFAFDTTGASFTVSGGNLQSGPNTFATFTSSGGTLTINFTSSGTTATTALVNDVLDHIQYTNTSDDPAASVTLNYSFNDGSPGNSQGSGATGTATGSTQVNITAVNDPPTLTTTGTNPTYTENAAGSDLFTTPVTVSAIEAADKIKQVVLTVSGLADGTNEILHIDGSDVTLTDLTSVTTATNGLIASVSVTGSTATVTLSKAGGVTSSIIATVVDGMTYADNGDNPTGGNRVVTLTSIQDTGGTSPGVDTTSLSIASTVNVVPVNDAPQMTAGGTQSYTEQNAAVIVDNTVTVSDVDSPNLVGATATISNGLQSGDTLHFTDQNGISFVSYAGGVLTLSGSASVANYQTALQSVTFDNSTNDDPTNGAHTTRTITWQVDDGSGSQNLSNTPTSTLTIVPVNDTPTVSAPASLSGTPSVAVNVTGVTFADVDSEGNSEVATFTDSTATFTAVNGGSVTVGGSGTTTVTLTGTVASINSFISGNHLTVTGTASDTIHVSINDQFHTGPTSETSATSDIALVLDNPPVVDLNGAAPGNGATLGYTENAAASAIAPTGTTTDTDSADFNGGSLTVHFSANGAAEDQLSILTDATILLNGSTVQYDADGAGGNPAVDIGTVSGGANGADLVVSFNNSGNATPTSVSALIEHIGYADSSDNPSTAPRSVLFTVNDGDGGSGSDTATVNVTAVNDPPVVDLNGAPAGTGTTLAYTENAAATAIAPSGVTTDVDSANFNGGSLTVHFSANGATEDQLSILTTGGVTVTLGTVSVGGNAVGTVSGGANGADLVISFNTNNATPAAISTLLEHIGYANNSDDPSILARSVNFTLVDGDGGTDTGSATATINVTAVNDPPVLNNVPATADYTENAAPVTFSAVFPNQIFVTDPDPVPHGAPGGNGLALSATVNISSGFVAGDELLVFDTTTATSATSGFYTGLNIQWNYDATTHILTLFSADAPTNSGDTLIDYAHVLDNIQFASTSDDPTNGGANNTRTLQWQIQDAGGTANGGIDLSAIYTTTLTVHPTNDAPAATITPTSYTATEQVTLNLKNNGIAVSDVDGGTGSETVTLSVAGEGVLNVTAGGSGAGVAGSGTNSVTITGSAAQINALLNTDGTSTVGYIDNTDTPAASATLTLLIHDNGNTGGGDLSSSDSAIINITAVDDVPVLNGLTDTPTFVENGSSVRLDANQNATVSDPELNVSPNKYQGASLTIMRHGGPNADDSFVASGSLDVTDVSGTGENVSLDGGVTFIGTFVDNGDGSIKFTFNASATATNIHDVMSQIFYSNASENPPATVPVDFIFDDGNGEPGGQPQGAGGPGVTTATLNVQVTQVDDPPALLNVAVAATYSIGSAGAVLSNALQVFDPDAAPPSPNPGLVSATVTITAGFLAGDQLFVNLPTFGGFFLTDDDDNPNTPAIVTNISVTSNAGGQLVLGGQDSVLHYQEVLDAVSYSSSAVDPTNAGADQTRTINWKVSDGALDNQAPSVPHYPETTLGFNSEPSVDLDGSTAGNNYVTTFTENGAPIPIANANVSVTDSDDSSLSSATIVLTNAKAGDALSIAGALPSGISSSIDTSVAGKITVSLFDSGTLADYQTALGQIRFVNNSDAPDPTDRDITVQVANSGASNTAHATVHVVAVNDAPVNAVPGPQSVNEDTNLAIAGLAISDADAGAGTLSTTLSVAHGALTVASAGGAVVGGSGTNSVTLTGTLAQINTTLSASGNVVYKGAANFNGGDTLNVVTNDGGNTGTGGAKSDTDTVGITVNAVNDAPVFANFGAAHASTTEQTFVRPNPGATISDVDLDAFNAGAGNYSGASLIIGRTVAANPEDTFFFGGPGMTFTVDNVNHILLAGGQQFATYNIPTSGSLAGTISVNFNSLNTIATSALVNNVLDHITYEDTSDTPPASVTLHYTFNDGNFGGQQGSGGNLSDTANRIVDITAVNDPPVITSDGGGDTATVSVLERTTAVTTVVAPDPDGPSVTYSIVGGVDAAKFQIDGATGALSFVTAPNFDIPTDTDHNNSYLVQVRASDGSLSDDQSITVQVTDNPAVTSTVHWVRSVDIVPHPAGWVPQGNGDFNGDGTIDDAWYNASTNNIDIWTLSNGAWAASSNVGSHPAGYQPVGFGDYNGDHTSDVLWYNPTTRDVDLWKVSNGQWAGSVDIGTHPAGSTPVLSGDFNGDGTSDIAWYNPTTNAIDVWKISTSGQWAGSVDVGSHPAGYQPVLAGDFNGDGTTDIAWYNPTTHDLDIWKMSNGGWAGSVDVGTHPAGWQPLAAADFSLDGTSDIAWYNPTTNDIDIWLIKNGQWAGSFDLGSHPGSAPGASMFTPEGRFLGAQALPAIQPVVAVGAGDFDHSGVADIMWQDKGTGHIDNWMLAYS
jgi:hypothetical protein